MPRICGVGTVWSQSWPDDINSHAELHLRQAGETSGLNPYNSKQDSQQHRRNVMAKLGRPKKVTQVEENGETSSGYFRRVFKENPHLLVTRSNEELMTRWLTDHPGHKEAPKNVHKNLAKIKGALRHK